jgi:hypothetical protein
MIIKIEDLQEFVEFLRKCCGVRQITTFVPAPNESGEFFRALAENHLVIGHVNHNDELSIFTDDQYQVTLWDRWAKAQKNKPLTVAPVSISATDRLKALLLGKKLPHEAGSAKVVTPASKARQLNDDLSGSTCETIDLST